MVKRNTAIGVVPDIHFATLHVASDQRVFEKYGLQPEFREFSGGTGELAEALANGKVNIGIGLTDGFVTSISKSADFRIIATFVETPMKWIILLPSNSSVGNIKDLNGKTFGITKFGGGSHINTILITSKQGWIDNLDFNIKALGNLNSLVAALKTGAIDACVWEPFSIKSLLNNKDLKALADEIIPPWPCFMVATRTDFLNNQEIITAILAALQEAARIFHSDKVHSVEIVSKKYNLSKEDSEKWFESVRYSLDGMISQEALENTLTTLMKVGAIKQRVDVSALISERFVSVRR
ncbi:MAG: ABC transporter substrate-binding protein [Thermoproteota archaeon]|nr:ABC transporter substrate-binding protein [Thermoproteota archaeon]